MVGLENAIIIVFNNITIRSSKKIGVVPVT